MEEQHEVLLVFHAGGIDHVLQALFLYDVLDSVLELQISVFAHEDPHDILIVPDQGEDLREYQGGMGVKLRRFKLVKGQVELADQLLLRLLQEIIDVPVMEVEGAPVEVRHVRKLLYGDLVDLLCLHELRQAVAQKGPGLPDPPVLAFRGAALCPLFCSFHESSPFSRQTSDNRQIAEKCQLLNSSPWDCILLL